VQMSVEFVYAHNCSRDHHAGRGRLVSDKVRRNERLVGNFVRRAREQMRLCGRHVISSTPKQVYARRAFRHEALYENSAYNRCKHFFTDPHGACPP
jgi:hypothetical protein